MHFIFSFFFICQYTFISTEDTKYSYLIRGNPRAVESKEINSNIITGEFEFESQYYINFPHNHIIVFTKPLRSGRIWHKVNF